KTNEIFWGKNQQVFSVTFSVFFSVFIFGAKRRGIRGSPLSGTAALWGDVAAASSDLSIYKDTSNCQIRKKCKNALFSEFEKEDYLQTFFIIDLLYDNS
ncbi:MAG: hypothetical protein J5766_00965, partial [Clostridia bacterium]|nr:hypothetical protein [Clostridia bacterium]